MSALDAAIGAPLLAPLSKPHPLQGFGLGSGAGLLSQRYSQFSLARNRRQTGCVAMAFAKQSLVCPPRTRRCTSRASVLLGQYSVDINRSTLPTRLIQCLERIGNRR
ncbi:hypothetical protein PCAR4_350161 [Paraburkholderia caribensis]|nr:hypothetical protein PCAR4_350161 [Paraburkholderia caribensis]